MEQMHSIDECFIPVLVHDLDRYKLFESESGDVYCYGSVKRDRFVEVPSSITEVADLAVGYMDGERTLANIQEIMLSDHQIDLDMVHLCNIFASSDLLENNPDQGLIEQQEFDKYFFKVMNLPMNWTRVFMQKISKKTLKLIQYCMLALIVSGSIGIMMNWNLFIQGRSYQIAESHGYGVGILLAMLLLSIMLHEAGHAVAAYGAGLRPDKLVVGLYLTLTPMIYLKIPGMYTVNRWSRIKIWSAGIAVNAVLGSMSFLSALFMGPGDIRSIFILCSLANFGLIVANLSPLLPLDGYYIMATLMKRTNIRKNAFGEFKKWITRKDNKFRGVCTVYFMLTTGFMAFLLLTQLMWLKQWAVDQWLRHNSLIVIVQQNVVLQVVIAILGIKILLKVAIVSKEKIVRVASRREAHEYM